MLLPIPYLSKIFVYPIKSLDGVAVTKATVLKSGALQHDREFAIVDQQGKFVNGKRYPKIHAIRSLFDFEAKTVSLQIEAKGQIQTFHLDNDRANLEAWLSDYFSLSVTLQQNSITGFPDDTKASGPTVISTGSLETVASWFPGCSSHEIGQRLRTNLEIANVPPFWEDRLFTQTGNVVDFQIGDVHFQGINPCQRCIVPTRHPLTGKVYPDFQKIFIQKRQETLPAWVISSQFNHFYRLSVNTCISESEAGKILQVGNAVK